MLLVLLWVAGSLGCEEGAPLDSGASLSCDALVPVADGVRTGGALSMALAALQADVDTLETTVDGFETADLSAIEAAVGGGGPIQTQLAAAASSAAGVGATLSTLETSVATIKARVDAQLVALNAANPGASSSWVEVGTVADVPTLASTYPLTAFAWGIDYENADGVIQEVMLTTWNDGWRLATVDPVPYGDDGADLKLVQTILYTGTDDISNLYDDWYHARYDVSGGAYVYLDTDGVVNTARLYARRRK